MSTSPIRQFCKDHGISEVEAIIPDMAGVARGKVVPAEKYIEEEGMRLPESIFLQTVTGEYPEDESQPLELQYAPAHAIRLAPGGTLARIAGREQIEVNSLHSQGIDRLGAGLAVEGRAPDGVVEAVRVTDAPGFAVAVQWHPEWQVLKNDFSKALFAAFGDAARAHARGVAAANAGR